jgi:hypothetical protein
MSTGDHHDLIAARAMGGLEPEESAAADAAAAADPDLARELRLHRATVARLEHALPPAPPPEGLFDRILADVADPTPAAVGPAPRARRRRRLLVLGLGGGAVAVATAALIAVAPWHGSAAPVAQAVLAAPGVTGEARLYDDHVVVRLDGLGPAPAGHHYQVWVLPKGSQTMESVVPITAANGTATVSAPLPGPGPYAAVDVSIDPDGATATEPGPSVVVGKFAPV